jgi:hypothetical protein
MSDAPQQIGRLVLLDEMLPRKLARELPGHRVTTVTAAGWSGLRNGELIRRAEEAAIEVFITADRNMEHQQPLLGRSFGVVVISIGSTKLRDLVSVAEPLRIAVGSVGPGEIEYVRRPT